MKRLTLTVFLLFIFLLGFTFPKTAMACSVQLNGLRENQPITFSITFVASDVGKTYQIQFLDPTDTDLSSSQNYSVNATGTVNQSIPSAKPGWYSVRVNDLSRNAQICRSDVQIVPLVSNPPTIAIPPVKITNPGGWLSLINPGFGPTGASLGSDFGLNFFTNNVANFIISTALFILFTASLIFLLIGGVMWVTSGGNKEGAAKAKSTVTYAIIGLALGLASFVLINIVGTFFGLNLVGP